MTTTVTTTTAPAPGQAAGTARAYEHGRGARSRSGRVGGPHPLRDWVLFGLIVTGRVYRALLLTLLAVAVLPMLIGWTGYVVRTGSMEPGIKPGDVVVGRPFGSHEQVPVGRVMVFQPPKGSGDHGLHVHRVVERRKDGRFTTAGDANPTPDPVPVDRKLFKARAIILVHGVGSPLVWIHQRRYASLFGWAVVSSILLAFSVMRLESGDSGTSGTSGTSGNSEGSGDPPAGRAVRRTSRRRPRRARRRDLRLPLILGLVSLALLIPESASAAFTATTRSGSNTWKASATLQQPYTAAVMSDSPWALYRLDDTSGTNAQDSSVNGRTGTYTAVAGYAETGALPNNPGNSVRFAAGFGRMVSGGTALSDPTTYSVELWFKTTSTAGGKLIGFENSRNQTSTLFDREAILRTDGKVAYLGGGTSKVLVSTNALNNGAWHQLVITAVPNGASNETTAMYVDGALVASGNTAKAASVYTGWWRVGYGLVPIGPGYPVTGNYTGWVDDVAIYTTQLSATRVAAHYAAR